MTMAALESSQGNVFPELDVQGRELMSRVCNVYANDSEIVKMLDERRFDALYDALLESDKSGGRYYACMQATSFLRSEFQLGDR